jgi:hypothetical protein
MKTNFIYSLILFFLISGCQKKKLDLDPAPVDKAGKIKKRSTEKVVKNTNNKKVDHIKENKFFSNFKLNKKRHEFFNLPVPPSYVIDPNENQFLKSILWFFNNWDLNAFESLEESDAAKFFSSYLISDLKDEENSVITNKVKQYLLPVLLYKDIPLNHIPAFQVKDLKTETYKLYSKGFNMGQPSLKDLKVFLNEIEEISWKGKRGGVVNKNKSLYLLKTLFNYLNRVEVKKMKKIISLLSKRRKIKKQIFNFKKYSIHLKPLSNGKINLWLTFKTETRFLKNSMETIAPDLNKNPPLPTTLKFPNIKISNSYLISGGGSCTFCLSRNVMIGDYFLPKNVMNVDWNKFGDKIIKKIADKKTFSSLKGCFSSTLDYISQFHPLLAKGKGFPAENYESHNLSKKYKDGEVLKAVWIKVLLQYLTIKNKISSQYLKPGCELTPAKIFAYKFIMESALKKEKNLDVLSNLYFIRSLFSKKILPKPKNETELEDDKLKPAIKKKKIKFEKYNLFFNHKNGGLFFNKELMLQKLIYIIESLKGNFGDPTLWLKNNTPPLNKLISDENLKKYKNIYETIVPETRVFIPSLIKIRDSRVTYLRKNSVMEYFLNRYHIKEIK